VTITEACAHPMAGDKAAGGPPADIFAFPVSSAQQRLWFLEQFQPGSPIFNSPVAVRMDGPLEAVVLEQAIHRIIRRHEILRTSFDLQNGLPVQVVAPSLTLKLPVSDLSSLPPANGEAEARRLAADEARRPFDLQRLPLLRVKLLRLSATRHVFVLTVHHIIFDGWSLGVFFRELATIYERLRAGKTAELPEALKQSDRALAVNPNLQAALHNRALARMLIVTQNGGINPPLKKGETPAAHPLRLGTPSLRLSRLPAS